MEEQGRSENPVLWVLGPLAVAVLLAFILTETIPFRLNLPQVVGGTQIQGGYQQNSAPTAWACCLHRQFHC